LNRLQQWQGVLLWAVFVAGLLVQLFSPHLKVSNGAFVIPPSLTAEGKNIRPDEIVAKQRHMQLLSAILTVSGALGLAFRYRDTLTRMASRRRNEPAEGPASGDSARKSASRRGSKGITKQKGGINRVELKRQTGVKDSPKN
jgi:hypothetical protein